VIHEKGVCMFFLNGQVMKTLEKLEVQTWNGKDVGK
jgi:hypothetical protein